MISLDSLRIELKGLEFLHAQECDREVREGAHHSGTASVVQVLAQRRTTLQGSSERTGPAD